MVVYGGVWWCVPLLIVTQSKERLLPGVFKLALAQVHGGVWWCMVVCPFVNSHAEQGEAEQTPAIMYNTESLPAEVKGKFTANETKKYRDYVCSHYKLRFVPVAGNGNCFFLSVAMLLDIDPIELRQQLVDWLRQCGASPDPVSQDCCLTMQKEVKVPLTRLVGKKWVSKSPADVLEYLLMSSEDGVWAAGRISPNTAIHHLTTGTTFAHTPPHRHIQERTGYTRSQRFTRFVLPW
jgi:hypothetical protein